jgi:sirohydrochlorin ferrochelatase
MKAILYIGHGTRSKIGVDEPTSFIESVIARIDVPIQEVSFLELTEPSIEQGFQRCVDRGATDIAIVPLFLLAAGHIKQDIPEILSVLKKQHPHIKIDVKDPFGVQGGILDAIAELVRETAGEVTRDDSLLIVGRGSSDPSIHTAFEAIAKGVGNRLGVEQVSVCYLAAAQPRLQEGLELVTQQAANRVIVIPYLLFPGLLLTEINHAVHRRQRSGQSIIQTGPLARHRVIADVVLQRAVGEEGSNASFND